MFSIHPNTSAPSGSGHGTGDKGKEVMSVNDDDNDNDENDDNDDNEADDDDGGGDDPSWRRNY